MASSYFQKIHHIVGLKCLTHPSWPGWALGLFIAPLILTIARLSAETIILSVNVAYTIAFVVVACSIVGCALACPNPRPRITILIVFTAVICLLGLKACAAHMHPLLQACLVTIALLAGGTSLGAWVGYRIETPSHLLAVAVVSSLVDAFSVLHDAGPSAQIAQSAEMLSLLALPWPMLGTADLIPVIGVGDVVFAALYVGACRVHRLSLVRTCVALSCGFLLTLVALFVFVRPIPALPFLGMCIVIAHPQARSLFNRKQHH